MKYIVVIAAALVIMFIMIICNVSEYNSLTQISKEKRISESIKQSQLDYEATNTEKSLWDKVHDAQNANQTEITTIAEEIPQFLEIRDENGEIIGYQQIENIVFDEEGNPESYDAVGNVLTPEEYEAFAEKYNAKNETSETTKRAIPKVTKKSQETLPKDFQITVN